MESAQQPGRRGVPPAVMAITLVLVAVAALAAGYLLRWGLSPAPVPAPPGPAQGQAATVWTCSMHPQVRQPRPGKCPICFMDLIPLEEGPATAADASRIALSPTAVALMQVRTAPIERKFVEAEVRMVGKVDYDETRLAYLAAWVPGRLDRLFVDYTGMPVRKGDHMVEIYSPALLAAQEEFLQARKAADELRPGDSPLIRDSAAATLAASREKLRLLGLTQEQVEAIARQGKASDRLTIVAPAGGIVVHVNARQGMYVDTGTRLFTIADLSQVWVRLDAYESDLAWLRYGQGAEFTTASYPGRTFRGMVSFIDPILTEQTRTVRVRVNAPNPDGALKPGMFVHALVRSRIAAAGKVMAPDLAGKWISPMHPEIIRDGPGTCDVCGMPLVRAESLGYAGADPNAATAPLVIPISAALRTGRRAIVYVEAPSADGATYEMRQVVLGPRAGDWLLVEGGLAEDEQVVVAGGFRIDSERQLRGLPSMMHEGLGAGPPTAADAHGPPAPPAAPPAFRAALGKVLDAYFAASDALAGDDAARAAAAAGDLRKALGAVPAQDLPEPALRNWQAHARRIAEVLDQAPAAGGIEPLRAQFALLSDELAVVLESLGPPDRDVHQLQCPMAFGNRGAMWLQGDPEVRNPYFGAAMLRCGSVVRTLRPPAPAAATRPAAEPAHDHTAPHH